MKVLHWEILDIKRKNILPMLKTVSNGFYLAGGTALASQLGHRDSVDFDFLRILNIALAIYLKKLGKR